MGTSTYDFEGTTGALPGAMSSGFATMALYTSPAGTSSDFQVSTAVAKAGSKSGKVMSTAHAAVYYTTTFASTTYLRGYFYLTSGAPSNSFSLGYLYGSGFTKNTFWGITTSGELFATRDSSATGIAGASGNYFSSASAIPAGEWIRFETTLTATSVRIRTWHTSGAGLDSTGTPDLDSGTVSGTSLGTIDQVAIGAYSDSSGGRTFTGASGIYLDDFAISDAPFTTTHEATATPSITSTGASAATLTRPIAGAPSTTATGAAVAGLVLNADGVPSITAIGSADASVITTHNAEAAGIVTVSSDAATMLTRPINATATLTASAVATMANQTAADGVIQAIGAARIVIEGETSPGFLYSTVAKNVLTS